MATGFWSLFRKSSGTNPPLVMFALFELALRSGTCLSPCARDDALRRMYDWLACRVQISSRGDRPIRQGTKREAEEAKGSDRGCVRNWHQPCRIIGDETCNSSRGGGKVAGLSLERNLVHDFAAWICHK
ncbi:hypothetical protein BJX68DRAFT_225310 [Aspergillus pseudodeflectus]|uniref:Secreted protein n=1 Tax=Aspergillus pseudodeflectus TaxID=176178 RepID=A0ABR4L7L3_9EURO